MSYVQYEYAVGSAGTTTSIYGVNYAAQSFTIGVVGLNQTHKVTSVKLRLSRSSGTHTNNFIVGIYATSGGKPIGTAIKSFTIAANSLTLSQVWYEYILTGITTLNSSTMYAIVISYPLGTASLYVKWHRGTAGYAGGISQVSTDSGSNWSNIANYDFGFYEYGLICVGLTCGIYICYLPKPEWGGIQINQDINTTGLNFWSGNRAVFAEGRSGKRIILSGIMWDGCTDGATTCEQIIACIRAMGKLQQSVSIAGLRYPDLNTTYNLISFSWKQQSECYNIYDWELELEFCD